MPEGFYQVQYGSTETALSAYYSNDSGDYIIFNQKVKSLYKTYYDNNNHIKSTITTYNNQDYIVIEYDSEITYIWDNGQYIFEIVSNVDKKTMLDICNSTKINE